MMSIFSPRSSDTTMRTREPRRPTPAPPGAPLDDAGLDAAALLVAPARHLLRPRQDRLHLAQVDEGIAVVVLLHDAGDDLADAVGVLVVHDRALRLVDALAQHLLRRLPGDAAEALGRDVHHLRRLEPAPLDLGLGLLLGGLLALGALRGGGVERPLRLLLGLDRAVVRMHLEVCLPGVGGDRPDDVIAGLAVEVDAHRMARVGHLLVCRQQRLLNGREQRLRLDPALLLEQLHALPEFLAHRLPPTSATRFPRRIAAYGKLVRSPSRSISISSFRASINVPVNCRRPATGCSVRTCTRLPTARR